VCYDSATIAQNRDLGQHEFEVNRAIFEDKPSASLTPRENVAAEHQRRAGKRRPITEKAKTRADWHPTSGPPPPPQKKSAPMVSPKLAPTTAATTHRRILKKKRRNHYLDSAVYQGHLPGCHSTWAFLRPVGDMADGQSDCRDAAVVVTITRVTRRI